MEPQELIPSEEAKSFNFLETDPRVNFAPWFLTLCAVLILVGGGLAGYFKYQAYQNYKHDVTVLQEIGVEDPTAGWQTYRSEELGFSFKYPKECGYLDISIYLPIHYNWQEGKSFNGLFEHSKDGNGCFYLGGITEDYTYPRGADFVDFVRYTKDDGAYHLHRPLGRIELLQPSKVIEVQGKEILILRRDNFQRGTLPFSSMFRGALINLPGSEFQGLAITSFDTENNPISDFQFEQILSTFEFFTPSVTTDWQTYRNEKYGFEFKYPPNLTLLENRERIILHHQISYENSGDCDMLGSDTIFPNLTDLKLSFRIIPGEVKLDYIDGEYSTGELYGVWVYGGSEGCGVISYYFENNNNTLVVERDNIQALSGISSMWSQEEILNVPGVISREKNTKIFNQILFTFKFIN